MSTFTPEKASADIGVYGLGVMGANLARNLARNGYATAVFNRTPARTEKLMAEHGDEATFVPASTLEDFVASLRAPRVAIMMVQAGPSTDAVMEQLADLMDEGDIIVDCGNSLFTDTIRREKWAAERGLHFVGAGVSGGEEGALWGPSIMPGGTPASYDRLGPMFEAIAGTYDGVPCCTYIGANGAGHFVKMVHNGIEYADMQVIAEAYTLLREGLGATPAEIADIFAAWNEGELNSYLMEITVEVLRRAPLGDPFLFRGLFQKNRRQCRAFWQDALGKYYLTDEVRALLQGKGYAYLRTLDGGYHLFYSTADKVALAIRPAMLQGKAVVEIQAYLIDLQMGSSARQRAKTITGATLLDRYHRLAQQIELRARRTWFLSSHH